MLLSGLWARRLVCTSTSPRNVDVLVVGGGLVGSALAASLASNPLSQVLSIAVVDPAPPPATPQDAAPPSLRTSTISPSSVRFLSDAGIWERVEPARRARFDDMVVWESPSGTPSVAGLGTIRFDSGDLPNADGLGYVVDNSSLRAAIFARLSALRENSDVTVLNAKVQDIDFADDSGDQEHDPNRVVRWPVVRLDSGDEIRARLIVAADGARSRIRDLARFDWFSYPYDQTAVVANVTLDRPLTTAYQRFLSTGPIAMLPVASNVVREPMANIIWSTTPAEAEALSGADDVLFVDELNAALFEPDGALPPPPPGSPEEVVINASEQSTAGSGAALRIPTCQAVIGARGRFPLSMGHSPQYVDAGKRTVLLGDAAHNVHPLAGQGVNLGFADARALADVIASAAATGRDIGGEDGAPLRRYETERLAANVAMMGTLHGIQAVFGHNSWAPFNVARRLGVSTLNRFSSVKKLILKAMS